MWLLGLLACTSEGPRGDTPPTVDSGAPDTDTAGEDTGAPRALPAWRGTWVAQIKDMEPGSSAHCQDGGWYRDDVDAMRTALRETGQNTYAGYIDDGDDADCWFLNLEDMLEAISPDDDITIFGAVKTGRPLSNYTDALGAIRERSVDHPELRGLLIDDFFFMPQTVFEPDRAFSVDDMATLAGAAHDGALPEAELWTHIAGHAAGELLIPGVVLGAARCEGCTMLPAGDGVDADESWVELTHTAAADSAAFSLLLRNELREGEALSLQIALDGSTVEVVSLDHGNPFALRRIAVTLPTTAGQDHTVRVSLHAAGEPVADRIELSAFRLGGEAVEATALGVYRDASRGASDADLMAEDTSPGHIVPWIDGVLLHYWDDPTVYDAEAFRHLFSSVCPHLEAEGVRCVATMWGNSQWDFTVDRGQLVEKLSAAGELAEGVVVFRYPLDMHNHTGGVPPDIGVYREQAPLDGDYDLMGFWPGYTRGIPGWAHTWRSTATCDGDHTLRWEDNDANTESFRYSLQVNGVTAAAAAMGDVVGAEQHTVALEAGDVLSVVFEETASIGNVSVMMQAALDPPGGCPDLVWEHAASVDPEQGALHDCYAAWFRGESHEAACL